ncbi:MAG: hypothetical protein A2087_08190 [Spirochaetes bacterium GWD1_61_31]|nr:MAG: hypothetical protein A2Y37_12365 [Spirochaetes bacterium GWB1_60_80]OHD30197.1 MAG: hypothetical protein A2004_14230 [Spirochaetes bacterium GWC1_61_12]OHD39898.1 MAG: hypothetical protein A2087_08190 [Spirochaetes bacterium GWD1_61_31]OHD46473.1 MAG: hypothetical protein A2Y35_10055 [Spirochaetes bacterium GWE1_60_18]OHD59529.1 MAG: hypothetical protein A2Y32_10010 [Spirochaetes bacterium GWF1_60_12]
MDAGALDGLYSLLAAGNSFVAFDFETTGLSPAVDRIVEIGAIRFGLRETADGWSYDQLASFHSLVNPRRPIPATVSSIHGIYDLDVASAPTFAEIGAAFLDFLGKSVLVAHNASFDCGFLQAEATRNRLSIPANPVYDTIILAKTARPRLESYALGKLAKVFGIAQQAAHRGDDDARVCMEIFYRSIRLLYS